MTPSRQPGRDMFVGCHPGNELRAFGWISKSKPVVCLLTDGSGSKGRPRLNASIEILQAAGAESGPIFGRYSDLEIYHRLRTHDHWFFINLADELAFHILENGITRVVADAAEGFNPGHEACRMVVDTAIGFAVQRGCYQVENYAVQMVSPPCAGKGNPQNQVLELDDEALEQKVKLARGFLELSSEVEKAISQFGEDAFRLEVFHRVTSMLQIQTLEPDYEKFGTARVGSGIYPSVIRYADHIAPLKWALKSQLEGSGRCAA